MGLDEAAYEPEVLELLHQPWTIEIRPYSDGGFFARVVELRGCMTEADTIVEVVEGIEVARAEWLASALEHGDPIPTPQADNEYSGKIFVRTSSQLHRAVAEEAARRGVSMSQWVSEILAAAVGLGSLAGSRMAQPGLADDVQTEVSKGYWAVRGLIPKAMTIYEEATLAARKTFDVDDPDTLDHSVFLGHLGSGKDRFGTYPDRVRRVLRRVDVDPARYLQSAEEELDEVAAPQRGTVPKAYGMFELEGMRILLEHGFSEEGPPDP